MNYGELSYGGLRFRQKDKPQVIDSLGALSLPLGAISKSSLIHP